MIKKYIKYSILVLSIFVHKLSAIYNFDGLTYNNYSFVMSHPGNTLLEASFKKSCLIECNLSGLNLSQANLTGADLSGTNLAGTNLSGTIMIGANLIDVISDSTTNLHEAILLNVRGTLLDYVGSPITNDTSNIAERIGNRLVRQDLSRIDLSGLNLAGVDLSHANLSGANFSGANLSGANLSGAIMIGTNLTDAVSDGATNLQDAILLNVQGGLLDYVGSPVTNDTCNIAERVGNALIAKDLSHLNLSGLDLRNINLSGANLSFVNFKNTNLKNALLATANLAYVYLAYANLAHANLINAVLSFGSLFYANLSCAKLINADLRAVDLRGANLINADLVSATIDYSTNLEDAILLNIEGTLPTHKGSPITNHTVNITERLGDRLVGVDLSYVNLSGLNLSNFNLSRVNLSGAIMIGTNLTDVISDCSTNLQDAVLFNTQGFFSTYEGSPIISDTSNIQERLGDKLAERNLSHIDLSDMDLSGVDLSYAKLIGTNLSRANLSTANLNGVIMINTNLADVVSDDATNLEDAILLNVQGTLLSYAGSPVTKDTINIAERLGSALMGNDLECIDLSDLNLSGIDLTGANLRFANFKNSNLSYAKLAAADLSESLLLHANLSSANLLGTNLKNANLINANLLDVVTTFITDFHDAILLNVQENLRWFAGSPIKNNTANIAKRISNRLVGKDLSYADLSGLDLHNLNLIGSNLTGVNFTGSNLTGVIYS